MFDETKKGIPIENESSSEDSFEKISYTPKRKVKIEHHKSPTNRNDPSTSYSSKNTSSPKKIQSNFQIKTEIGSLNSLLSKIPDPIAIKCLTAFNKTLRNLGEIIKENPGKDSTDSISSQKLEVTKEVAIEIYRSLSQRPDESKISILKKLVASEKNNATNKPPMKTRSSEKSDANRIMDANEYSAMLDNDSTFEKSMVNESNNTFESNAESTF